MQPRAPVTPLEARWEVLGRWWDLDGTQVATLPKSGGLDDTRSVRGEVFLWESHGSGIRGEEIARVTGSWIARRKRFGPTEQLFHVKRGRRVARGWDRST